MKLLFLFLLCALSACGDAGTSDVPLNAGGAGGREGTVHSNTGGDGGTGGTGGSSACRGVICDDGDVCTDDACDPRSGECELRPAIDGTPCDFDGAPGLCAAGVCEDAALCAALLCDDGLECTEDVCDPSNGSCAAEPLPDASLCEHGAGRCLGGACIEPHWGQPMSFGVSSIAGTLSPAPLAGADASGRTTAVWLAQRTDRSWTVVANHHTPGSGWGALKSLAIGSTSDADAVDLAVSANGEAVAIWMQHDTPPSIYANHYKPGTGWGSPVLVENNRALISKDPRVAIDASGNAIAVWLRAGRVYANHFSSASGWGSPLQVGLDADAGASPRIGIDADGNATVVWFQSGGLYATHYSAELGWQDPLLIETLAVPLTGAPELAVSADGDAVVVWIGLERGAKNLYANVYAPSSGWQEPQRLEQGAGPVFSAQLAMDPNGEAIVVWDQMTQTGRQVFARRYDAEQSWGPVWPLEEDGLGDAVAPMVSMDAQGAAIAVWAQSDSSQYGLRASRFLPELGWRAPELIAPIGDESLGLFSPFVSINAGGRALALWVVLQPPRHYEVWRSHFE